MIILIHGAYHGGWCWDAVADLLRQDGQDIAQPDLPGHGRDPGWLADQTMPNYIDCVSALLVAAPSKVTLVGHSMGAAIATGAANAHPDKVKQLVYLAAYIPIDDESVGDVVRTDPASYVQVERVDVEGLGAVSLKSGTLADAFYNDADARTLGHAEDRVQLQSPVPFRHKFALTGTSSIPKAAIVCTEDRAISPDHQRMMAARVGCDPILDLNAGHSPFATQPEELVDLLRNIIA